MIEIGNLGTLFPKKILNFENYDNCNKTAIYNYWGMKPKFCFDHKDKYYVNIPKKHILCTYHYLSHSYKTKCPKCKIKKSTKCNECDITASCNYEKLNPSKRLKHRKTRMVNIEKKHILCKKHDISHSKKSGCKKCKLDIDNYDTSSKYMQDKIYNQFKDELIEKIKKKFKNHSYIEMYINILNNTTDKKTIILKLIEDERDRLRYIKDLKRKKHIYSIKPEVNDLNKKTINLNKLIRKIFTRFKGTDYKHINDYIENEINIEIMEYKILKRNVDSIILKIKEIIKNKKEADDEKYEEDIEKSKLEDEIKKKRD